MDLPATDQIAGILLAAGRGRRFDPSGKQSKLLQLLPSGETVLAAAANHLSAVLPVTVVCRTDAPPLTAQLAEELVGCTLLECADADDGMATTLVFGLQQTATAAGWVIALADMPFVQVSTIMALKAALDQGADIAVPVCNQRRGNPVAFSHRHLSHLLALRGDQGARGLLERFPVVEVAVDDPGVLQDIDTVADIPQS
ncbi:nucleotidyltransferase family protein [Glaciimonas sp. Gout2]|uniref:nucleotidyltransferase family protein n=1 Tax=unclassified Glaciimonas TaxID=2644401 RepID=UPI002B2260CF|nr:MULTISPECIES: nucleotidyltransferase family protein [unclassified Glaciimonas]MEB0014192.1 nucleotidyltransferase family protein [Glaciimonas sp. Cout2]MEB0084366.1 nucleotidyltransferase family protein [Glaciimonas sp. Gout2]